MLESSQGNGLGSFDIPVYENQSPKKNFFKGSYIDFPLTPLSLPENKDWYRQSLQEFKSQGHLTDRGREREEPSYWYLRCRKEISDYSL